MSGSTPGIKRGKSMRFRRAGPNDQRVNSEVQIFIENIPTDVRIPEIFEYFSTVGPIKNDRQTKKPRIWLYHDKHSGEPTGECTVTYTDSKSQKEALKVYDGQIFKGKQIKVTASIVKSHMARLPTAHMRGQVGKTKGSGRGGRGRSRAMRGFRGRGYSPYEANRDRYHRPYGNFRHYSQSGYGDDTNVSFGRYPGDRDRNFKNHPQSGYDFETNSSSFGRYQEDREGNTRNYYQSGYDTDTNASFGRYQEDREENLRNYSQSGHHNDASASSFGNLMGDRDRFEGRQSYHY